jgi:hypothetical protein
MSISKSDPKVPHTEPSSKTEQLFQQAFTLGKPVFTFNSKYNDNLQGKAANIELKFI